MKEAGKIELITRASRKPPSPSLGVGVVSVEKACTAQQWGRANGKVAESSALE